MKTLEYLNNFISTMPSLNLSPLEELAVTYNLDVNFLCTENNEKLCMLNYSMESPDCEITNECRSLVILETYSDKKYNYSVVSRSFDRFKNYHEYSKEESNKIINSGSVFKVYDKIDGSLIKVFYYNGQLFISTRSIIDGSNQICNYSDITFSKMVDSLLSNEFKELIKKWEGTTFIFELTSNLNRIVTPYNENKLWLLAIRNIQGDYYNINDFVKNLNNHKYLDNINIPNSYEFSNIDDLIKKASELENLKEGFVVYIDNQPRFKIKNQLWIKIHKMIGNNGLSLKGIINMILSGEQDEYLSYYPEDKYIFDKYYEKYLEIRNKIYKQGEIIDVYLASLNNNNELNNRELRKHLAIFIQENIEVNMQSLFLKCLKNLNNEKVFYNAWDNLDTFEKQWKVLTDISEEGLK